MTTALDEAAAFTTPEGLRLLLVRLHYGGTHGWRTDPEAAALIGYAVEKYGALARKHGYDPFDAATAAFDAMRTRAVRVAQDPWAVVTRAVELTLLYDRRADRLLCSNAQARKETDDERRPAVARFSDYRVDPADFHRAFAVYAPHDEPDNTDHHDDDRDEPANALFAIDDAVTIFTALCWPEDTVRSAIEYVCTRLTRSGNRLTAFEALRRDRHPQALLDLDQRAWLVFLRVVLGNQHPDHRHTAAGRGLLLRLVIGDTVEDLLEDRRLLAEIATIRDPARHARLGGRHG
jgi:hypothetical protein